MKFICCLIAALFISFFTIAQGDLPHLLSDLKTAASDSQKVIIYKALFHYYEYQNPDSAVYYLKDGLKQFTERNYKEGIAKMTALLAAEDDTQGRIALAKRRYTEALEMLKELHDTDGISVVDNGLGVIEGKAGNYDAATKLFMEALKGYEATKNIRGIAGTYLKLGLVNDHSGRLDKALEYYNKSMELTKSHPSPNIVYLYNNIATVYGKKGDYKKALEYLQLALEKANTPEYTGVRILSLLNLGIVYDHYGDEVNALKYINEALQITRDKDLPEEHARVIVSLSSIIGKTDPRKANDTLKGALEIAKQLGQKNLQLEILGSMSENYKKLGNYKDALATSEQEHDIQDSLFNMDKEKEIANLQSEFDLEQSNAKVQDLQLLGHKNLLQRNIIVMVAFVMAITLIVLTFFLRKITKLNEELFKRETELRKSNTVKDKLFSIIGHDLRGPVGNIPMMLRIFRDESTTPEEQSYIYETLMEHSQASLETLDKLLYWGQAQIKGIGLKPVDFNPEKQLEHNMQLIKSTSEQKQITITNNVPKNISIHGDPAHFDFIVRNLLSNAVKFTHSGGSVTVTTEQNSAPGYITFAIKDTGVGITKEKTEEIFEPFSNSTTGTADERGTSIGLMLCKEFIIENGGKIWVESAIDKGSAFYFSFKTT